MLLEILLATSLDAVRGRPVPGPPEDVERRGHAAVHEHVEEAARELLEPVATEMGVTLGEPIIRRGRGTWHLRFPQMVQGLPVDNAWLAVSLRPGRGGLISRSPWHTLAPGLEGDASLPPVEIHAEEARALARLEIEARKPSPQVIVGTSDPVGVVDRLSGEPAWAVIVRGEEPPVALRVVVSAVDGRILDARDLLRHVLGEGHVFAPNPVVELDDSTLSDDADSANAVPDTAYLTAPLPDIERGTDGRYILRGPNVRIQDLKSPLDPTATSLTSDGFNYTRDDPRFEQVMIYHHADATLRYIQGLGFTELPGRPLLADAHALTGDQSYFDPTDFSLNFGNGGVDDAEDADIIVHELGHALQEAIVPGFGMGAEAGALGEGFGDYLAASRRDPLAARAPCVASWDATAYDSASDPPCLRRVDGALHYPGGMVQRVHEDGGIWAAALWSIRHRLAGPDADRLIIQGHYGLRPDATFRDAALNLLEADADLSLNARGAICDAMVTRGILRAADCPTSINIETVTVDDDPGGDGDGALEPGESADLVILLRSHASLLLSGVSVAITVPAGSSLSVVRGSAVHPDLAPGEAAIASGAPIRVALAADAACGSTIALDATLRATNVTVAQPIGVIVGRAESLPDALLTGTEGAQNIPDGDGRGVSSSVVVPGGGTVTGVAVSVDIQHPYRGDLAVDLVSPTGRKITLHSRGGGTADNLVTTYPTLSVGSGPGTLEDLTGELAGGTWTLTVRDWASTDTGRLLGWTLDLERASVTCSSSAPCGTSSFAPGSLRVRKGPGDTIVLEHPTASPCAVGIEVRTSPRARPSAGEGVFPNDPPFANVTTQDTDPGPRFVHRPGAGLAFYLVVETLAGGVTGPSGSYGY